MLGTSNNAGGIAQPFGLGQEKKHPPRVCRHEHETTWQPFIITTNSTSKNVVDMVKVKWKIPESTKNEPE